MSVVEKVNLVYFSATNTTKRVLKAIAEGVNCTDIQEYNITLGKSEEVVFNPNELVVFGFPVFAGRIPQISVESLKQFKGSQTPAIIVCVYGNREYDDALLELRDIVASNQFKIISAGAFIGQHSIFPKVGSNRPDSSDLNSAKEFGYQSIKNLPNLLNKEGFPLLEVKGNKPYKEPKSVPLYPTADKTCTACGKCVRNCPTQAIPKENPQKTDKTRCISCGRCIYVCPEDSRKFKGMLYSMASKKFVKAYSERKEPEFFFI